MRGHLAVRINDGTTDRHVTGKVRELKFTKTAPGGHMAASMRLILPRDTFTDLGPADRLWIYDSRTGRTVWEGYCDNPGATDGPLGQEFELSAMGGMVLASDRSEKLVYVDRDTSQFVKQPNASRPARVDTESDGSVTTGFDAGNPVATGYHADAIYSSLLGGVQKIGYLSATWTGGKTDAGYSVRSGSGYIQSNMGTSGHVGIYSVALSTAGESFTAVPTATDHTYINLVLRRDGGATNVSDDTTFATFSNVAVFTRLVDLDGTDRATVTEARTVDLIVRDLFSRLLAATCDVASSVVEASTQTVDQLAYYDGATAARIFDDLARFEPDFLWEILETQANGKHRFRFRAWPTDARYEISVKDGYNAPGGDVELCNRIIVYWTDAAGVKQATVVTQYVEALGGDPAAAGFTGRVKDADPETLPDGLGSSANATLIGQQILAAKANPPKAATATVRRPILDHLTGSLVMPWEIEPGYPVRVRETGDVLRLTEVEYADQDGAATLTLGEPTLTNEQRIANLSRRRA